MKDYILFNAVKKEVAVGNVSATQNGEGLTLFKYTPDCQYESRWNPINRQCRGLIVRDDATIVARPFKKFFNVNELPESSWDKLPWHTPYEVQEKLDGCFNFDTPILLADGSYERIGNIVNKKLDVKVMGFDHYTGKIKPVKILNYFNNGTKNNWVEIEIDYPYTLKSGGGPGGIYKLRVTSNHQFWKGSYYLPIREFNIGDSIYCLDTVLTPLQQSMIYGSLLGDSSVCKGSKYTGVFQGSNKDIEYVRLKQKILGNLNTSGGTIISGYGTKLYRYQSSRLPIFHKLRREWYPNDIKIVPQNLSWLNDIAIAFWYMDDGSLSHSENQQDRACFATNGFSKEDCQRLASYLRNKYNIDAVLQNSKGWSIRINSGRNGEINKFWEAISQYIPPIMRYKLPEKYRNYPYYEYQDQISQSELIKFNIINVKEYQDNNSNCGYDIETETHNFFAKGVLVHNSLGIGYKHNNEWRLATPGSFTSDQALKGTEILHAKYNNFDLIGECTPLFEIIYPDNRIVVDYLGETFLSLLAIFDHNGTEWHSSRVDNIANQFGFRRPKRYPSENINPHDIKFEESLREGYVIRFENGYRVKLKDPRYVRIHKLLNYLTPKGVIELIRSNTYSDVFAALPREIQKSFDDIRSKVQIGHDLLKFKAILYYDNMPIPRAELGDLPERRRELRKQSAAWIKNNVPTDMQSAVFFLLDNKDIEDILWKLVECQITQ